MRVFHIFALTLSLSACGKDAAPSLSPHKAAKDADGETLSQDSEKATAAQPKNTSKASAESQDIAGQDGRGAQAASSELFVYSGTSAEIGAQFGKELADPTAQLINAWLVPKIQSVPLLGALVANMKANAMQRYITSDLLDEIDAIGQQTGISSTQLIVANGAADIGEQVGSNNIFGCSSFVVTPERSATGKMLVGRNLDYPDSDALRAEWRAVVFKKTGALQVVGAQLPGMSGILTGINEKGVMLAIHVSHGTTTAAGTPATLLYREVLEKAATADEAVALLSAASRAMAMNVLVVDPKHAFRLEIDADDFAAIPANDAGILYVANHFTDAKMAAHAPDANQPDERWEHLQAYDATRGKLTLDTVKKKIGEVGGFGGSDSASNILAVTMDYATKTFTIHTDSQGTAKAVDGDRTIEVNLEAAFGAKLAW